LLQEPQQGVEILVEWVEIDVDGAEEEASTSEDVSSPTGRSVGDQLLTSQ